MKTNTYTLFWLTGRSEIVTGYNPADAMNSAGYGGGSVRSLDFYARGDQRDKYTWNSEKRSWEPTTMEKHTKQYAKSQAKEYASDYKGIERNHAIIDFTAGYMNAVDELAAPDLLEALKNLTKECEKWGIFTSGVNSHLIESSNEAIKKATL